MAEAIARHYFGRNVYFASAGIKSAEQDGLDMRAHKPHTLGDLADSIFDLIITLSPEAHHKALEFARHNAVEVLYWPTPDATAAHGSRDAILDAYRDVRERLTLRIKELFECAPLPGV